MTGSSLHSDPEVWAPRLGRLLDAQRDAYQQLDLLSAAQGECIETDLTDRLLELLGQRQGLVEQITKNNEEIAPYTRVWDRLAPTLPERHRAVLRERFDAVDALVRTISLRDEADRKSLEARRGRVGDELRELSRARGAVAAYGRGAQAPPRFQDSQA